jgi:hypothetical protein
MQGKLFLPKFGDREFRLRRVDAPVCISAVSASRLAERVQCTAKSGLAWQFFHMT